MQRDSWRVGVVIPVLQVQVRFVLGANSLKIN